MKRSLVGIGFLILLVIVIVFFVGKDDTVEYEETTEDSIRDRNQKLNEELGVDSERDPMGINGSREMPFGDNMSHDRFRNDTGKIPMDMDGTREMPDGEMDPRQGAVPFKDTESCEGLSEGDSCVMDNPMGESMDGICQEMMENLVCMPERAEGDMPPDMMPPIG